MSGEYSPSRWLSGSLSGNAQASLETSDDLARCIGAFFLLDVWHRQLPRIAATERRLDRLRLGTQRPLHCLDDLSLLVDQCLLWLIAFSVP